MLRGLRCVAKRCHLVLPSPSHRMSRDVMREWAVLCPFVPSIQQDWPAEGGRAGFGRSGGPSGPSVGAGVGGSGRGSRPGTERQKYRFRSRPRLLIRDASCRLTPDSCKTRGPDATGPGGSPAKVGTERVTRSRAIAAFCSISRISITQPRASATCRDLQPSTLQPNPNPELGFKSLGMGALSARGTLGVCLPSSTLTSPSPRPSLFRDVR